MANEVNDNISKLIDAISKDEEQIAALQQEIEQPVDRAGGQPRAINFEDTMNSLAKKYGISLSSKDLEDMKGMLGNFNNLSVDNALSLNGAGKGDSDDPEESVKGLFSSLFGGGNNSLFGNVGNSLFGSNSNQQQVTLTQNQLNQLLNNASNNASLNNYTGSALSGLSSLLGGNAASSSSGLVGSSLLAGGASALSKLFLVYLFMKLLRGGTSMII